MSDVKPDRAFLDDIQHGIYWQTLDGRWRHNTAGEVPEDAQALLDGWAICRPGGTAHLTDAGWELLYPTLTEST